MYNKFSLGLALALGLLFVGCGKSTDEDPQAAPSPSSIVEIHSVVSDLDLTDNTQPELTTITPETIFSNEYVSITTDSLDSDSNSTYLFFNLENKTDEDIYIFCESTAINDILIDCGGSLEISAHEQAYLPVFFNNPDLNICDISTIASISLKFSVYVAETAEFLCESDLIEIHTSQYGSYEQQINTDGQILYDENGIQLIAKGATLDPDNSPVVVIFAINTSDKAILIDAKLTGNASTTYETAYSYEIPANRSAVTYLNYYDEEGTIADDIKSIPVILTISDVSSDKEIGHTKALSFNSSIIEDYLQDKDSEDETLEEENIFVYTEEDAAKTASELSALEEIEEDDPSVGYYDEDGDYIGYDPNEGQYVEEDE